MYVLKTRPLLIVITFFFTENRGRNQTICSSRRHRLMNFHIVLLLRTAETCTCEKYCIFYKFVYKLFFELFI